MPVVVHSSYDSLLLVIIAVDRKKLSAAVTLLAFNSCIRRHN